MSPFTAVSIKPGSCSALSGSVVRGSDYFVVCFFQRFFTQLKFGLSRGTGEYIWPESRTLSGKLITSGEFG